MIGIYKITNPNGKIYIGQSRDIEKRKLQYSKYLTRHCRQIKLINSIKKYKWDNHFFDIIEECNMDDLNNRERFWQEYYNSIEYGLNCIYTKTNEKPAKFGIETRYKMSKSQFGKKLSDITKKRISNSKKGIAIGIGKKLTKEHKNAISMGFKPKFNKNEIIDMIEMSKNISLRKIALKYNTSHTTIKKYIKQEISNL